ncbi:MAG: Nif3-like dinuclear metal center hexameric protein [Bacteroidales bacterium]|nr:Nif3-like dinuclear metal center hexameric protein [Bacteroidales bacterium]
MTICIRDIIKAIEQAAPLSIQEDWDNSGLLVGSANYPCSGVMLALDVTPAIITQAKANNCNLVIAHHPVIFKGIHALNDSTVQGKAMIEAIKANISVYCAHTSLDNASSPYGVSCKMAEMLNAQILSTISPSGTGVIAELPQSMTAEELISLVKNNFSAAGARISRFAPYDITKIALGSGACSFLIPDAIALGAQAIITADVRYHDFLDYGTSILIIDLTHFDTEKCTKEIFKRIISQKIPNFAQVFCASETNPIDYK